MVIDVGPQAHHHYGQAEKPESLQHSHRGKMRQFNLFLLINHCELAWPSERALPSTADGSESNRQPGCARSGPASSNESPQSQALTWKHDPSSDDYQLSKVWKACPIGICFTLSGTFPYAPCSYLTNEAGVSKQLDAVNNNKGLGKATLFDYNMVSPKIFNLLHTILILFKSTIT